MGKKFQMQKIAHVQTPAAEESYVFQRWKDLDKS
jgi:hemerythrin superfamily protein